MFPHREDCPVSHGASADCVAGHNCADIFASRLAAFDSETHLIQDGLGAPPLVCASICFPQVGSEEILDKADALANAETLLKTGLVIAGANIAYDFGVLANERPDLLPLIFKAYRESRVYDVQIAQMLDAISRGELGIDPRDHLPIRNEQGKQTGRYSLAFVAAVLLGRDAKQNDFWRRRYAILEKVPIEHWPDVAVQYPKDDVRNTIDSAIVQLQRYKAGNFRNLGNLPEQVRMAFCLHLGSLTGVRTCGARVAALEARVEPIYQAAKLRFQAAGFVRENGTENESAVKQAVARAYGASGSCPRCAGSGKVPSEVTGKPVVCKAKDGGCGGTGYDLASAPGLPRTKTNDVSTSRDTLMESGDDELEAYGENVAAKLRDTYIPFLKKGIDKPICPRPNVLVASGRTSYESLIQLLPRKGGVRECLMARPGFLYCSTDFSAIQLCTLAQVCLWVVGYSRMAETINTTGDPGLLHTAFAAALVGKTTEEVQALIAKKNEEAKGWRQAAKAGNFGFPGGMGAAKLVLSKRPSSEGETVTSTGRRYTGIRFCVLLEGATECGREKVIEWNGRPTPPICKRCVEIVQFRLKKNWFEMFPEVSEYFRWVSQNVDTTGELPCLGPVDRVRGGLSFCDGANNGFQALESDIIKDGFCELTEECFTDRSSPLWGARPLFCNHDDCFSEVVEERAHEAAHRQVEILLRSAKIYSPDLHYKIEPALMHYWCKDAEPKYDASGRLVPWDKAAA